MCVVVCMCMCALPGDRRAASGADLSEFNLDSPLGRKSLRRMYDLIVSESSSLPKVRGGLLTSLTSTMRKYIKADASKHS